MVRSEYSSAIEGGQRVCVRFAITGRIDPDTYRPFVAERAQWLAIDGWVSAADGVATVVASGPEALVGALEMACTLGPIDALVDEIVVEAEPATVATGFRLL